MNINIIIFSKFASHQRTMVNSKHYDVTIRFSAMSGNNTESTESVTKKHYVTGDSQYAFHGGMLIQVTTPGLRPGVGLSY